MARVWSDLALAGGLGHGVDAHAAVDPAGVVALEEMVGQRRRGRSRRPCSMSHLQAAGVQRVQVSLEDAADQASASVVASCSSKRRVPGPTSDGPEDLRRAQPVEHERPPVGQRQASRPAAGRSSGPRRPCPASASAKASCSSLALRPTSRRRTAADSMFSRGQAGQLQARTVDDGLAELAHLGSHVERHTSLPVCSVMSTVARRELWSRRCAGCSAGLSTGSAVSPSRSRRAFKKA